MSNVRTLPAAVFKTAQVFVVIFAILLAWAVLPNPARADGLTDAQTQAVLNLLSTFGTGQTVLANVQLALKGASREDILKAMGAGIASSSNPGLRPAIGSTTPNWQMGSSTPGMCMPIAHRLERGSVGPDVSKLQAMLEQTGDLKEASTTGYFGSTTEAALKAWQARQGIVTGGDKDTTGFGAAGPQTRDALLSNCMQLQQKPPMRDDGLGAFGTSTGTTTRRVPPMPRPEPKASGVSLMLAPLEHVSSLLVSGTAAVFDGYISLFQ